MRYPKFPYLLAVLGCMAMSPAFPQGAGSEWDRLQRESVELYRAGKYDAAAATATKALEVAEQNAGPNHPDVANSLNNLAAVYKVQGRYDQAEPLYRRALAIFEGIPGPTHPDVANALNNLGALYATQGRYAQAEPLYRRALAIQEQSLGADHPFLASSLNNLALLYKSQGQYAQAEPYYRRSLALLEKTLGAEDPMVATSLNNLAGLYQAEGRLDQAEPLFKRSLAIRQQALGPDHPELALSLNNLADLYGTQGRLSEAEPLYRRALAILEKALGPEHIYLAAALNNLAALYKAQAQFGQAEPLYQRALKIHEKAFGADHPQVANSLNSLAVLYYTQARYVDAEPLLQRSLAIWEKTLGAEHPDVALGLNNLADLYHAQGRYAMALAVARRASAIFRRRIVSGVSANDSSREAAENRAGFVRHLSLLERNPDGVAPDQIIDESLQIVQLKQASGTSAAIARMAARFAGGDDPIAALIKRKQDALERQAKDEAALVDAASLPPERRDAAGEQALRDELARLGEDIEAADRELNSRVPDYQELIRPEPLAVKQVQALLHPEEAMVVYAVAPEQSWLWVVRPGQEKFIRLEAKSATLAKQVRQVRAQMRMDQAGQPQKVGLARLHALYEAVFAPAMPYLADVRHIMLVPDGPLQSLPFAMLVAAPPAKADADYRAVDWLAKHYALSVLPSVASIRAFRLFAKGGVAGKAFIGFGDPLLTDAPDSSRAIRAAANPAGLFPNRTDAGTGPARTQIADVRIIKRQARLPDSADEIKAMARIAGAGSNATWLQGRATEANVKALDLSQYRVIAFATHGVMADEIGYGMEPGLLLTPPAQGSLQDDGYLAAGEIARLKLHADWVLLSACNTAATDGSPGAEALSGLAKAFFYAGSRSLLVSHWPVASKATVPLTTAMLRQYHAHPAQGRAEAHRQAMLSLMNTPGHPEYAHPFVWASFVVVGEGGADAPHPAAVR